MKTTPLSSVEEEGKSLGEYLGCNVAELTSELSRSRLQAYTSLVEGIEGMVKYDIENPRPEYYVNRGEIGVYEHQQALNHWMEQEARNRTINDILENVVKPLYGKE